MQDQALERLSKRVSELEETYLPAARESLVFWEKCEARRRELLGESHVDDTAAKMVELFRRMVRTYEDLLSETKAIMSGLEAGSRGATSAAEDPAALGQQHRMNE